MDIFNEDKKPAYLTHFNSNMQNYFYSLIFILFLNKIVDSTQNKRDVNLCTNNLEDLRFRLGLLIFIKECTIGMFLFSLLISVSVFVYNLHKYNRIKNENIKLKSELDNIRVTLRCLQKFQNKNKF